MDPIEKDSPIERINYIDGQRLTKELLQKEQAYHINLRRWLSKSLFTPGVAHGLEVSLNDDSPKKAVVQPGLAIDRDGHAIVLVEPVTIDQPVSGRFLTISYAETEIRETTDGCYVVAGASSDSPTPTAWGGPTLVRAVPKLQFRNRHPGDNDEVELVLAEFSFDDKCQPEAVLNGPQRYATARQMAGIHTFALEGEKDLAIPNPGSEELNVTKKIYFHIRGRTPTSVVLYLRADKFSPLHYTELGQHKHDLFKPDDDNPGKTGPADDIDSHTHNMSHGHGIEKFAARISSPFELPDPDADLAPDADPDAIWNTKDNYLVSGPPNYAPLLVAGAASALQGVTDKIADFFLAPSIDDIIPEISDHSLLIMAAWLQTQVLPTKPTIDTSDLKKKNLLTNFGTELVIGAPDKTETGSSTPPDSFGPDNAHRHPMPSDTQGTGAPDTPAFSLTDQLTTFTSLRIILHYGDDQGNAQKTDITEKIREKLTNRDSIIDPTRWLLEPGLPYTDLSEFGTGPIDLNEGIVPGLVFNKGEYCIELSVDGVERRGGKIYYNLYVEAGEAEEEEAE